MQTAPERGSLNKHVSDGETMQKYVVGQVVYVAYKNMTIVPALIVEEITRKSKVGVETTYRVQCSEVESNTMLLEDIDGTLYATSQDAKKSLTDIAAIQINNIVENASRLAREWFNDSCVEPEITVTDSTDMESFDDQTPHVMLSDGTIAKVHMPKT